MKATRRVDFSAEEVKTIEDFFDLLSELGNIVPHISTMNLFRYLIEAWSIQKSVTGDHTLYLDKLDKYVNGEVD